MRAALFLCACVCAVLAGCETEPGVFGPNRAPETLLTFAGPVSEVNSHLRLHWFGEDPDGSVAGYEYRWTFDEVDTSDWVFTEATTDSFALPAPTGLAAHLFEVRAIDNDGMSDPSPASQLYTVNNIAPEIDFENAGELPSTSLPAVTIAFATSDSNGADTVAEVVAWLDGDDPDTDAVRVPASVGFITLRPENFSRFGTRTVALKALDDAGSESPVITHTMDITEPVGNVILIDDMPDNIAGGTSQTDPFYLSVMQEVMGATPFTVHKIENGGLRTEDEASAIFDLFDTVVWYQGTNFADNNGVQTSVSTFSLGKAGRAIRELQARGGTMYLASMNVIGSDGAFDDAYASEVLGVHSAIVNEESDFEDDTNFFLKTRYFTGQETWFLDGVDDVMYPDVRVVGTFWGMEMFETAPGAEVLYSIPADIVFSGQAVAPIATRVQGTGTLVYMGFPLSRCSFQQLHKEVLRNILRDDLGLPGG